MTWLSRSTPQMNPVNALPIKVSMRPTTSCWAGRGNIALGVKIDMGQSASKMYGLVEEFDQTNQSCISFCKDRGIKYSTFLYWRKRHKEVHNINKPASSFVSVDFGKSTTMPTVIKIRTSSGVDIEIPL